MVMVLQVKEQQRDCKDTVNRMVGNSVVMGKMEERLKVTQLMVVPGCAVISVLVMSGCTLSLIHISEPTRQS